MVFLNAHLAQSLSLSIWLAKARFEQLPPLTSLAAHPPLLTRLAWPTRSAIISFKVPCSRIVNECDHRAHDISKNILKCHSMLSPDLALRHCIAAPLATALPLAAAIRGSGGSLALHQVAISLDAICRCLDAGKMACADPCAASIPQAVELNRLALHRSCGAVYGRASLSVMPCFAYALPCHDDRSCRPRGYIYASHR